MWAYKLSKLIVQKRDNDGNADMNTNGEKHLLDFLLLNNLLEVVFDVGANVGHYSNLIVNYNKDINIYAFELVLATWISYQPVLPDVIM
jgi:hypothetical protein